jgi:hypothetical protein
MERTALPVRVKGRKIKFHQHAEDWWEASYCGFRALNDSPRYALATLCNCIHDAPHKPVGFECALEDAIEFVGGVLYY